MIEATNLTKIFGEGVHAVTALNGVSLDVPTGSFFTLLGPSGCGKTTLLRLIAGFELPNSGEIRLDGQPIGHLAPHHRPVNTVFQSYALFPHMTVSANIGFGLKMLDKPKDEIDAVVTEMLDLVQMQDFANRRTDQLSGGQQQRVALARALAPRPKVLLLDEPLSALDFKLRKEMQSELKRLQSETGITFVFVTHDQGEALAMSDQIAVMSAGQVRQLGTPEDIYKRPNSCFVADFIGDTNIIAATLMGHDGGQAVIRFAQGREFRTGAADSGLPNGPVNVALHPEAITVADGNDTDAPLRGVIVDSTYFGAGSQLQIRLSDGAIVRVQAAVAGTPGAAVGLMFDDSALHVLSD